MSVPEFFNYSCDAFYRINLSAGDRKIHSSFYKDTEINPENGPKFNALSLCSLCAYFYGHAKIWNTLWNSEKHNAFKSDNRFIIEKSNNIIPYSAIVPFKHMSSTTLSGYVIETMREILLEAENKNVDIHTVGVNSIIDLSFLYDNPRIESCNHAVFLLINDDLPVHYIIDNYMIPGSESEKKFSYNFGYYYLRIYRIQPEQPGQLLRLTNGLERLNKTTSKARNFVGYNLISRNKMLYLSQCYNQCEFDEKENIFVPCLQTFITKNLFKFDQSKFYVYKQPESENFSYHFTSQRKDFMAKMSYLSKKYSMIDSVAVQQIFAIFSSCLLFMKESINGFIIDINNQEQYVKSHWKRLGEGVSSVGYLCPIDIPKMVIIYSDLKGKFRDATKKNYKQIADVRKQEVEKYINFASVYGYIYKTDFTKKYHAAVLEAAQYTINDTIRNTPTIKSKLDNILNQRIFRDGLSNFQMTELVILHILFQLFMSGHLIFQKHEFAHNDLHTENMMFNILTEPITLIYVVDGREYRLTTPFILKLIDYGNAGSKNAKEYIISPGFDDYFMQNDRYTYEMTWVYFPIRSIWPSIVKTSYNYESFKALRDLDDLLSDVFASLFTKKMIGGLVRKITPEIIQILDKNKEIFEKENFYHTGEMGEKMKPTNEESKKHIRTVQFNGENVMLDSPFKWAKVVYHFLQMEGYLCVNCDPVMVVKTDINGSKIEYLRCSEKFQQNLVKKILGIDINFNYSCSTNPGPNEITACSLLHCAPTENPLPMRTGQRPPRRTITMSEPRKLVPTSYQLAQQGGWYRMLYGQ